MDILVGMNGRIVEQIAASSELMIYSKGPNRQGEYAGFIANPDYKLVMASDHVFLSSQEAEGHMHEFVKAARLFIKKGTLIPENDEVHKSTSSQ